MARYAVSIVTPPRYPHSAAFREVAETLQYGLQALGHDAVLTDEIRPPGRRPIILGSNLLPRLKQKPAKDAILYNLEQIDTGSAWLTPALVELFRRHEVWDYSQRNADRYPELGLPRPRVLPVGFYPGLTRIPAAPVEDIDVLFYGSLNERRERVLATLQARGLNVKAVFGVYGAERDSLIARAKIVLNVHFYEAKVFEMVRVSYLLANRRCVVSERGADAGEERGLEAVVAFAPYEELVETCVQLVGDPAARARLGEAGFGLVSRRVEAELLREVLGEDASQPSVCKDSSPATAAPSPLPAAATPSGPTVAPPEAGGRDHTRSRYMNAIPVLPPVSAEDVVSIVRPDGRRILVVACGDGELGAALAVAGAAEVVGLDPCARLATRSRLGAVYRADPDAGFELPYPAGYFDVVLVEDFSRLLAPGPALAHLRRWLSDAGRLVCIIPNALHEASLAALLARGCLPPHGGARPMTVGAALDALEAAGFTPEDEVIVQRTEPGPAAEPIGRLAAALGGDQVRIGDGLTLVRAIVAARADAVGHAVARPFADPWCGSRSVKVLIVPTVNVADDWTVTVALLARGLDKNPDVTLGLALPAGVLESPPPLLRQVVDGADLDVLLTERPHDLAAWQRLLAGASTLVAVASQPELVALARLVGTEVQFPS
ncbi:MAG TPA: methyltransferase domain-containing protein [Solirubrobacterales bacterium]